MQQVMVPEACRLTGLCAALLEDALLRGREGVVKKLREGTAVAGGSIAQERAAGPWMRARHIQRFTYEMNAIHVWLTAQVPPST